MDPLILLDQAEAQSKFPRPMARKVRLRMKYLVAAVQRVEKASGLRYPPYYVEPVLPVAKGGGEYGEMGVLFARVFPTTATAGLTILVQFTAALVAFGSKGTIEAVAAHEFTHYMELVRKLSRTDILKDERASTLFEAGYADTERTVPARLVFKDKALVGLVTRKFKVNLFDPAMNKKVSDAWIAKDLPMRWVDPRENTVGLGIDVVSSAKFDQAVLRKLTEVEGKMPR